MKKGLWVLGACALATSVSATATDNPFARDETILRLDGLDLVGDIRLVEHAGSRVVLETETETVELVVEEVSGSELPASCGAEPEPTTSLRASVVERHG